MAACPHIPITACRACGSLHGELRFVVSGLPVVRCTDCSHVFLALACDTTALKKMYEDYGGRGEAVYFRGIDAAVERALDECLSRCKSLCAPSSEAPRLLDIGCGNGALLERAQAMGYACEGLEISPALAAQAEKRNAVMVHRCFLAGLDCPENSFDVITMYDLLEHLENPRDDLQKIFRLLKPGGIFFIFTPDDEAVLRKAARAAYALSRGRIRKPLEVFYYQDHLSYFNRKSLSVLLNSTGFDLVGIETRQYELSRLHLQRLLHVAVSLFTVFSQFLPVCRGSAECQA